MKKNVFVFVVVFSAIISMVGAVGYAQELPAWADYHKRQRQFSAAEFVTGFCSEEGIPPGSADETLQRLASYARQQLLESVYVSIKSTGLFKVTNVNAQTHESFSKSSISRTSLNLSNLKTETFYHRKTRTAYAFARASKSGLVSTHKELLHKYAATIKRKVDAAVAFEEQGALQPAMKNWFEALPVFREAEASYQLMLALAPAELPAVEQSLGSMNLLKNKVTGRIARYQQGYGLGLSDVAFFMARGYKLQTSKPQFAVRLEHFTYRNTGMTSRFSARFASVLEKYLVDVADFPVVSGTSGQNPYSQVQGFGEENPEVRYVLDGTFLEDGDRLNIISVLRHADTGVAIASMEGALPLSALDIAVRPANYEVAIKNLQTLSTDVPPGNDLVLEAWTNKGSQALLYQTGETMKVFLQVNKPCYVRFVYHTADGEQVLLLDNYFIDEKYVNQAFEVPEEFVCTAPYGVEMLQVNVQSKPFDRLPTRQEDGYVYVLSTVDQALASTRGFKKKEKVLSAEKLLQITTLE